MLIDRRSGPVEMMCIAAVVALSMGACAHTSDPVDRELELLRAKFEALEKVHVPRYAVGPDYGIGRAPTPTVHRTPTHQPAPQQPGELGFPVRETHPQAMPGPEPTPRLPVVRVDPLNSDPFANGQEPPIRIGKKGRLAPPAQKPETPSSLEYARLDEYGNLVDQDGKIIYRAGGEASLGGGTTPKKPSAFDDPHESPERRVERMMRAPRIDDGQNKRPTALPTAPSEREMRGMGVSAGEEPPINVRPTPELRSASQRPSVQSKPQPEPKVIATPIARAIPKPKPVPSQDALIAPAGANQIVKQVTYKGAKERAAQALYKKGRQYFVAANYKVSRKLFRKFLKRFHNHELADNALYWLGEAAYAESNWVKSLSHFQDVIIRYPAGNKLAGSMLKSALCYAQMGDKAYAVKMLTDVETMFPLEKVAQIARTRRMALSDGGL